MHPNPIVPTLPEFSVTLLAAVLAVVALVVCARTTRDVGLRLVSVAVVLALPGLGALAVLVACGRARRTSRA